MRDKSERNVFEAVLRDMVGKAKEAAQARNTYRVMWAKSYSMSTEKTDTGRKAEADIKTEMLRIDRDLKEIEAQAALHLVIFHRGPEVVASSAAAEE